MNGATTEPLAKINSPPKINITMIKGSIHNFLRVLRKIKISFKNSIIR